MNRKNRIHDLLQNHLQPIILEVNNESHQHSVPENAETHFSVTVASYSFKDKNRVERHRLINQLLKEEFDQGLHALRMNLYTPEEWEKRTNPVPDAPKCRGGHASE